MIAMYLAASARALAVVTTALRRAFPRALRWLWAGPSIRTAEQRRAGVLPSRYERYAHRPTHLAAAGSPAHMATHELLLRLAEEHPGPARHRAARATVDGPTVALRYVSPKREGTPLPVAIVVVGTLVFSALYLLAQLSRRAITDWISS